MLRFHGKVEQFAEVDVSALSSWIAGVPLEFWPQQGRPGEPLCPSMVTDLSWYAFGRKTDQLVNDLMQHFPSHVAVQRMLSAVMPGNSIPPHTDQQRPEWACRVHVPLTANERSLFVCGGETFCMMPGNAFKVNTLKVHSVSNEGPTPRIHFMFDVQRG